MPTASESHPAAAAGAPTVASRGVEFPTAYTIFVGLIIAVAAATWIVPA